MPRSENQKLKLLTLMQLLLRRTDEHHGLTVAEMIEALEKEGISAERKAIYHDLELLRQFGLDIETRKGEKYVYFIASREFELPELKLLVDAIQSARFITRKKSEELMGKLEGLTSIHEARQLRRQVVYTGRVKAMNERIYYTVDALHTAIAQGRQITFRYFEWALSFGTAEKISRRYRRDGALYTVSPWTLLWDSENYYMVAYDEGHESLRHYRVDKMTDITVTEESRTGQAAFAATDMATYTQKVFSMFAGEEETVTLRFARRLIGVVADRFGSDAFVVPDDDPDYFRLTVQISVSEQFFAWMFSFGREAKILSPPHVAQALRDRAGDVCGLY
ncbi:MAG: WYL domain-containing protein [Oscillospiraceae bacterium]|nr:WYL domain-containing protein [Oscillospiraceae bacterium]